VRGAPTPQFGVYVHVPFCRRRCDYCAFATYTDRDHLMGPYVDACLAEVDVALTREDLPLATSVFFGGGTPSRLGPCDLGRLLTALPTVPGVEVTVECHPEDLDAGRLAALRAAGVTRLSVGVQSTVLRVLDSLEGDRARDRGAGWLAGLSEQIAATGFASWNLDLIFGAAGEDDADWERTLADVLALPVPPPHVSTYALTVEPGTALAADPRRHPDEDVQARRYELADAMLGAAGYRWEEISNWALPGHECSHNRLYWTQGDYRGIGSAAHSHRRGRRWWNVRSPDRYIAAVRAGRSPVAGEEVLDGARQSFEALALALRTAQGVPDWAVPEDPELEGLVVRRAGQARLTIRGRLLANEVTSRLVLADGPT
jgi:putative oxygen-independent coproporphyrinogen III oxidase